MKKIVNWIIKGFLITALVILGFFFGTKNE